MHDVTEMRRELMRLARKVGSLEELLRQFRRTRAGAHDQFRQIRWAETVLPAEGAYPAAAADPTVFPIRFFDAHFEAEVGQQDLEVCLRQDAQAQVCYSEIYLPLGTRVPVFWLRGLGGCGTEGEWFAIPFFAEEETPATPPSGPTTTPAPACRGSCKWIWNDADQVWTLDSDNCAPTTEEPTTAEPTTEEPTAEPTSSEEPGTGEPGTTADCRRHCPADEDTSTTSTTTPEPVECKCVYPDFCGEHDEDCTFTFCAQDVALPQVACTSTSTTPEPTSTEEPTSTLEPTSTGEPTSTTDDPCSTTMAPACQDGCDWFMLPTGWHVVSGGCASSCPCPEPEDGEICDTAHTDCVQVQTSTTSTTVVPCQGNCTYWWIPLYGRWVRTEDGCAKHSSRVCYCVAPSEDGDQCAPVEVPCQSPETSTTTTTANPCTSTSSTTSTTSSTTTSTTTPCEQRCSWRGGDEGTWILENDPCPASCPCHEPALHSRDTCEVARTPCTPQTSTTTAEPTSSTTTSTTTSSTTTAAPTTTAEPTTAEPTTAEPTTEEPTTAEPTTGGPTSTEEPTSTTEEPRCASCEAQSLDCCDPGFPGEVVCYDSADLGGSSCCTNEFNQAWICNSGFECCDNPGGGNCCPPSSTTSSEPTTSAEPTTFPPSSPPP